MRSSLCLLLFLALTSGCKKGSSGPRHRKRAKDRDGDCFDKAKPNAYFYAAENRTDYAPDDPFKDGCVILVPDHLFCCPAATPDAG